jgi:hypothetical protein
MANYTFYDTKTKKEFDISMPISELDTYIENNPHLQQVFSVPHIADPTRLGLRKPDSGFRDVLKRIKKASGRRNTVNTW